LIGVFINLGEKIKVLFISHSSNIFGAEKSLLLLLKNINREHFEPIVVLPMSGPLKERVNTLKIKIYEVKSPWWIRSRKEKNILLNISRLGQCIILEIIASCKIFKIVKQEKINIIYTNTIVNFSGAIVALITKVPHIWHIREIISKNPNLFSYFPNEILFNFIVKFSNKVIANSIATANQFKKSKSNKRIIVIYNAVDTENFKYKKVLINDKIKFSDWLVAVIGALQKRKGQDDVIHAIKIAKKNIPNIKLLIIGDVGDIEFKNYLKILTSKLNISNNVIFTGYRNDVPQILSNCKVLVMPSWNEPFGRVVIEAMAAGIPVIGVNAGGPKEIIQDGISGYLIPSCNPSAIAEKIIYLYHHQSIGKKMGENGKKIVKKKFNVKSHTKNIEKILYEIAGNKK